MPRRKRLYLVIRPRQKQGFSVPDSWVAITMIGWDYTALEPVRQFLESLCYFSLSMH
jgi:hypothetical protein